MEYNLNELNLIRIATATPKCKIADIDYNIDNIKQISLDALAKGSKICLFPELSVTGYSCGDLFFQDVLLEGTLDALTDLKVFTSKHNNTLIVGAPFESSGKLFNCAVVISNGEILGIVPKIYLCNNSEYYEERWFSSDLDRINDVVYIDGEEVPFGSDILFQASDNNLRFGIEICEDLWALKPPGIDLAAAGAVVLFNLSASNEYLGKLNYRRSIVKAQSGKCISAYIYSSSGPGESSADTVFSGHSMIASNGKIIAETKRFSFENNLICADIDLDELLNDRLKNNSYGFSNIPNDYRIVEFNLLQSVSDELLINIPQMPFVPANDNERDAVCEEIVAIQTTALMKRLMHIGVKNVVIGVSGGLDSTLALLICAEAYKRLGYDTKGIKSITMPGLGTTQRTKRNAVYLANKLGTDLIEIDISEAVKLHFRDIGQSENNYDITYENSQARERTQILMDYANKVNGIVIGTGDLSEIALGWATYNGDHMSMYGLNSGIPKTLIKFIIKWFADIKDTSLEEVLYSIIDTPISPELLPADENDKILQETEEKIGPYIINDFYLYYFVRHHYKPSKLFTYAKVAFVNKYSDEELLNTLEHFLRRFIGQQFKRNTMPDGVKVGTVALSPRADWRMPSDASVNLWIKELRAKISI